MTRELTAQKLEFKNILSWDKTDLVTISKCSVDQDKTKNTSQTNLSLNLKIFLHSIQAKAAVFRNPLSPTPASIFLYFGTFSFMSFQPTLRTLVVVVKKRISPSKKS